MDTVTVTEATNPQTTINTYMDLKKEVELYCPDAIHNQKALDRFTQAIDYAKSRGHTGIVYTKQNEDRSAAIFKKPYDLLQAILLLNMSLIPDITI